MLREIEIIHIIVEVITQGASYCCNTFLVENHKMSRSWAKIYSQLEDIQNVSRRLDTPVTHNASRRLAELHLIFAVKDQRSLPLPPCTRPGSPLFLLHFLDCHD